MRRRTQGTTHHLGTCRLPGVGEPTQLREAHDGFGRPFGMLALARGAYQSVVLQSSLDGAEYQSPLLVGGWLDDCDRWLAALRNDTALAAVAFVVEPPIRAAALSAVGPAVLSAGEPSALSFRVALTFDGRARASSGRPREESAAVAIGARLPKLCAAVPTVRPAAVTPMSASELAAAVHVAYDPSVAAYVADAQPGRTSPLWRDVGPSSDREAWDHYRHDLSSSVTWALSASSASSLFPEVLADLAVGGKTTGLHVRTSILYRRATVSSAGPTGGETAALRRFGLIATVTAPLAEDPSATEPALEGMHSSCRRLLRRAYGAQASAFAAGLPLGLEPSEHLAYPRVMGPVARGRRKPWSAAAR